jgi:sulfate/thiosulfate transport system substrate-binding protein
MKTSNIQVLLAALALAAGGAASAQQVLLNASYDVAREYYKDINAAFVPWYRKTTGQDVRIEQSHGGSSAQARAVAEGLDADVVTMNTTTDIAFLADRGLVAKDWQRRFPAHAAPTTSTMLFLVRKGNPKGIRDWDDLVRPGVQVVAVNPKTSGSGRYAYLAAWGYVKKNGGSDVQAADFVGRLYRNVPALARGGRDATSAFLQRRIGDVLVTFESEVEPVSREFGAGRVEVVVPSISIVAENPVAVVEPSVARKGTADLAQAYLGFLYSRQGQEIAARHHLRPRDQGVMAKFAGTFRPIRLFTVQELFGSLSEAQKLHFDDGGRFDRLYALR